MKCNLVFTECGFNNAFSNLRQLQEKPAAKTKNLNFELVDLE